MVDAAEFLTIMEQLKWLNDNKRMRDIPERQRAADAKTVKQYVLLASDYAIKVVKCIARINAFVATVEHSDLLEKWLDQEVWIYTDLKEQVELAIAFRQEVRFDTLRELRAKYRQGLDWLDSNPNNEYAPTFIRKMQTLAATIKKRENYSVEDAVAYFTSPLD